MFTPSTRPHIAYVSRHNPHDRRSWSGISHYMAASLQKHCGDITIIDPPILTNMRILYSRTLKYLRFSKKISFEFENNEFDAVFVPQSAPALAFLKKTDIPIIFLSDSTWRVYRDYYPHPYTGRWERRLRDLLERRALEKSKLLLYPSEWAARSAEVDYGIERRKIHVVPFGANLDEVPPKDRVLGKQRPDVCRLLFLGGDWERKGGRIAVETLVRLHELGLDAELTVCGCVPPADCLRNGLTVIPRLDKRCERDRERLSELFSGAEFLLLPTRAECFGIVFCEASAYGVPIITTDTGGVSGAVSQGVNGHLLPLDATGADYARLIYDLYRDDSAYAALVRGSREMYDERLNWDAWGSSVREFMMEVL